MIPYTHVLFFNKFIHFFGGKGIVLRESSWFILAFIHGSLGLLYWIFFYNLAHIFSLIFSISSTLMYTFFVRMRQSRLHLVRCVVRSHYSHFRSIIHFRSFQYRYVHTLNYFFRLNRMYSRVLLWTLLVLCPISVGESMWLMLGLVKLRGLFIVIFFDLYQNLFILALHLALTFCTRRIYAPSKVLLHIMAQSARMQPRRNKKTDLADIRILVRLEHCIAALQQNHNRYGFTYGNFGLVSMGTFTKVSLGERRAEQFIILTLIA